MLLEASAPPGSTVGADKGYDVARFVADVRVRDVTPHVAQKVRWSAIDGRTTRHAGYHVSQRKRKLVHWRRLRDRDDTRRRRRGESCDRRRGRGGSAPWRARVSPCHPPPVRRGRKDSSHSSQGQLVSVLSSSHVSEGAQSPESGSAIFSQIWNRWKTMSTRVTPSRGFDGVRVIALVGVQRRRRRR